MDTIMVRRRRAIIKNREERKEMAGSVQGTPHC
jgi:hypothetical protein